MVSPQTPPTAEWVTYDRAWVILTNATGIDSPEPLEEAYKAGLIRTRRVRRLGDGSSQEVTELAPLYWANKDLMLTDQNDGAVDIEVSFPDLMTWLRPDEPAKARAGNKRGPKPIYDWDRFWIEVVLIAGRPGGLPKKQAGLEKEMADWFVSETGDSPSDSTIRERVGRLYRTKAGN